MIPKLKILIVDDRKENLLALRGVLAELDAQVVESLSGNDALVETLRHDFALALLDVRMPEMDGYELAALMRGAPRTRRLPIIFLTAEYGEKEQVFKGYEAGAVDYMIKPYDPEVLLSKVRVFLELHRATNALAEKVAALAASEERYRNLVTTVPDIVYRIDQEGRFTFLNDAVRNLGYMPEELIGTHFSAILLPADIAVASRDSVLPKCVGTLTGVEGAPRLFDERRSGARRTAGLEVRLVPSLCQKSIQGLVLPVGDDYITVEVNSSGLYSAPYGKEHSVFLGTVGIIRDISVRKRDEDELRIAAVAFASQNGMVVTDPHGVILRVNPAFTRLTGFSGPECIGQTMSMVNSGRHDRLFYQRMWESLREKGSWQGEIWNRRKNNQVYAEMLSITAIVDPERGTTYYIGSFTDITQDKEAEAEIHRLAYYDALTGLPNRRLLQDRLAQALAATARSRLYGAMFFIDLDNFKSLNDTRGHDVGDLLMVEVAKRLRSGVREGDTVARQGGDEFVVLVEDLDLDVNEAATLSKQLGEKLREAIDCPFNLNGYEYHGKVSIGVGLFNHQDTVEELFKRADLALYHAKNAGRNTLRFFDPAMQSALDLRSAMESELRQALQRKELLLHYQPQIDSGGRVVGAEALLRWQHPQRGLVPPNDFIPLAEDTGLIIPIGLWVMEMACTLLKARACDARNAALDIAVNVSARQFRQADFVAQVQGVLEASGANPACLKLELTESLVLEDVKDSIEKMQAIKRLGVKFAMDDFGTGYSSLAYLAQLPLDQIKIDQSFVHKLPGNRNEETIARTIIAMGRGLEMDVIAEGVETQAQHNFLDNCGCHAYQGYLFSRPLPLDEFEDFVKRSDARFSLE
jgi:diguanylate cyclase (GGDEF)-like protein/PAS domain S-box-containing protein